MFKISRKLHNWLGLVLFVQIALWFFSGLVMSVLPIDEVRGNHLTTSVTPVWHSADIAPSDILSRFSADASLALSHRLYKHSNALSSQPVYVVSDGGNRHSFNARSGELLSPLSESDIISLAEAQYTGAGSIDSAALLTTLPQEAQTLTPPMWQVQISDDENTRLYLDPDTGAVARVRTDRWRLFDFVWMLHIMDYETRSDFNHPLLIGFSASALLFTLTGVVLLWQKYRPRRRFRKLFR